MMRRLSFLPRRDRKGTTAIEFALIAPVMMTLIAGTIEVVHFLMMQVTLESALSLVARENSVALTLTEDERNERMRTRLTDIMHSFPAVDNGVISIETTVYRTFGSAYPEAFDDANENGIYDEGETFDDRNRNGVRDADAPVEGEMGGLGDVVSYSVTYPAKPFFPFLRPIFGDSFDVTSSTVARNEPEKSVL
jgi:Flp pilus assembly protein TadG